MTAEVTATPYADQLRSMLGLEPSQEAGTL